MKVKAINEKRLIVYINSEEIAIVDRSPFPDLAYFTFGTKYNHVLLPIVSIKAKLEVMRNDLSTIS